MAFKIRKYIPYLFILLFCVSCAATKRPPYKKKRKKVKPCDCPTYYKYNEDKTYALLIK